MKKLFAVLVLIPVLFLGVSFNVASAKDVPLGWNAPTENEDGSPLTDLAGYKVYYGTISGNLDANIDVGNVTETTISLPSDGSTYYFALTAYDTSGNESVFSDEISRKMPDEIAPKSPTGCRFLDEIIE